VMSTFGSWRDRIHPYYAPKGVSEGVVDQRLGLAIIQTQGHQIASSRTAKRPPMAYL